MATPETPSNSEKKTRAHQTQDDEDYANAKHFSKTKKKSRKGKFMPKVIRESKPASRPKTKKKPVKKPKEKPVKNPVGKPVKKPKVKPVRKLKFLTKKRKKDKPNKNVERAANKRKVQSKTVRRNLNDEFDSSSGSDSYSGSSEITMNEHDLVDSSENTSMLSQDVNEINAGNIPLFTKKRRTMIAKKEYGKDWSAIKWFTDEAWANNCLSFECKIPTRKRKRTTTKRKCKKACLNYDTEEASNIVPTKRRKYNLNERRNGWKNFKRLSSGGFTFETQKEYVPVLDKVEERKLIKVDGYIVYSRRKFSVHNTSIKLDSIQPSTPQKVSICKINEQNKIVELEGSKYVLQNRKIEPQCAIQPSTPKRIIRHNLNRDSSSKFGPQARIELIIAKQMELKSKMCGMKKRVTRLDVRVSNSKRIASLHEGKQRPIAYKRKRVTKRDIMNLVQRLKYLKLDVRHETAIVPYRSGDRMMVPLLTRKRRLQGKVDLDPESNRVWELLMTFGVNYETSDTDEEREKWWEEQRKALYERIQSFIVNMELILGDREFSPWKGSVVDSVVGVYLTQNVSDHLSSSAFMSLAARFPLSPKCTNRTENVERTSNQETAGAMKPENLMSQSSSSSIITPVCRETSDSITIVEIENCTEKHSHSQEKECSFYDSKLEQTWKSLFVPKEREPEEKVDDVVEQTNVFLGSKESTSINNVNSYGVQQDYLNKEHQQKNCEANCLFEQREFTSVQQGDSRLEQSGTCLNSQYLYSSNNLKSGEACNSQKDSPENSNNASKEKVVKEEPNDTYDWDKLRKQAFENGAKKERSGNALDSLDYEAVRRADNDEVAEAIKERGQNNILARKIKNFLDRTVNIHGSIDLEWLREVPPEKAKEYLLNIDGLGIKSVECVRLLTLHHQAFPVDTNVGRICVRLGWVPLQPLPESVQLHLLELYPVQETIQKYLWPRLCKLDHRTLYKLHYLLIAAGKVFCTKLKPNCNACPMRGECKHFASAFASSRLALPGPNDTSLVGRSIASHNYPVSNSTPLAHLGRNILSQNRTTRNRMPIIEEPASPESIHEESVEKDIEDYCLDGYNDDDIPTIKLNMEQFTCNLKDCMQDMNIEGDMSQALVSLTPEAASIPMPKLKNVNRMRTIHVAFELEDTSPILEGFEKRDPGDPCPYILAIWTPGETSQSTEVPKVCCNLVDDMCNMTTCFRCSSKREAQAGTVRGTILIPCRTANRGSFPLNGTYFQVNEVFADHYTSHTPINVPTKLLWRLRRAPVYMGTSVSSMLKDLTTGEIQLCFWKGYVCVRAYDRETRRPKPLSPRLHLSVAMAASKVKEQNKQKGRRSTRIHRKNS